LNTPRKAYDGSGLIFQMPAVYLVSAICHSKGISMYSSSWIQALCESLTWMSSNGVWGSLAWPDHHELQSWWMLGSPSILPWDSSPNTPA